MRIDIDTRGVRENAARAERMADRAGDARPAFRRIVRLLEADTEERFDSRGRGRWPRLDADTIRRKARDRDARVAGNASRVLVATGALLESLTSSGRYAIRDVSHDELRFGTSDPVANIHQHSKSNRREVLDLSRTVRRRARDELEDWITGGAGAVL